MRFFFIFFLILFCKTAFSQQQIIFRDTLGVQPTGWKFRNSSPHDWKWYNNAGVNNGGGLRMKLPNDSNYVATPKFLLQAGVTYTASFKSRVPQGTTSRKINVGYNKSQFKGGTTYFFTTYLPINSYATPPFSEYNPTFTVPTDGNYCLVFYYEENGYTFTYLDEIIVEKTLLPTTDITFPASNSIYSEGTDLTLTASADDADGTITKVEFFANGIKLSEDLVTPYGYLWKDILPKDYIGKFVLNQSDSKYAQHKYRGILGGS